MNRRATVFIVDDDAAVADSLTLLLEQDDLEIIACQSAEDFLAAYAPVPLGCAIVDIHMPGLNGIQLQEEMVRRGMLLPVVFLTGHGDIAMSVRAIKAGAVNFLTKPITAEALLESVQMALTECERRNTLRSQNLAANTLIAGLTDREREVMTLAAKGLANKEIARQLGISHRTVEIHKARVMKKTGASTLLSLYRLLEASKFET